MNEWILLEEKLIPSLTSTVQLATSAALGVEQGEQKSIDNKCARIRC